MALHDSSPLGKVLVSGAFCCILQISLARAQDVIGPFDKLDGKSNRTESPKVELQSAPPIDSQNLPDPSLARQMATKVIASLDSLTAAIEKNQLEIGELDRAIRKLDLDISRITLEKEMALREIKEGMVCTGCNLTASELIRAGVTDIKKHLQENSKDGTLQPLSAEETTQRIKVKGAEKDHEIAAVASQRDEAKARRDSKLSENRAIWPQIQEGLRLWQTATTFQQNLLAVREKTAWDQDQADIAKATNTIRNLEDRAEQEQRKAGPDPEILKKTESGVKLWKSFIQKTEERGDERSKEYWKRLNELQSLKVSEWSRLGGQLARTSECQRYPGYSVGDLPEFHREFGPISLHSSPGQLGIGFDFGSVLEKTSTVHSSRPSEEHPAAALTLKGGLTINADSTSLSASAFISAFLKVPAFTYHAGTWGVSSTTTYGPDGTTVEFSNEARTFKKTKEDKERDRSTDVIPPFPKNPRKD
jgi:hypothetical protein